MNYNRIRLFILAAVSVPAMFAQVQTPTPVSQVNALQWLIIKPTLTQLVPTLHTAALAQVGSLNGNGVDAERGTGSSAAVYAGAGLPNALPSTPLPAENGPVGNDSVFDFKQSGDSAQAWSTMTGSGLPYLLVNNYGKSKASGTATWTAKIQVGAQATRIYAEFTLPRVKVTGFTEQDGPGRWQSRFRGELMVNKHPVWASEAMRMSQLNQPAGEGSNCSQRFETAHHLSTFGATIGLSESDKEDLSTKQSYYFDLGVYPAGQEVEVSLVLRLDTQVLEQCCKKSVNGNQELFCTRATANLEWDNAISQPAALYAGPGL